MSTKSSEPLGDWSIGMRIWLEHGGHAVLGPGRFELLQGIESGHSISAAARKQGMSYRHAWLMVQTMNQAAGRPLVVAATGGTHGGGAKLTPFGRQILATFRDVHEHLQQSATFLWPRVRQAPASETVHVAAAMSLDSVLGQLLSDYAQQKPDMRIRAIYGASDELVEHLLAGAPVDLFVTADAFQLKELQQNNVVEPESLTDLAENSLAVVGLAGQRVKVRQAEDLLRPEFARIALAAPSTPLGRYTRLYLRHEGIYESLMEKALLVDNSRGVVTAVRAGQAPIGLTYASDGYNFPDCRLLYRIPRQPVKIRYTAAVVRTGFHSAKAREFLAFLASPAAAERFRNSGFVPAGE